MGHRSSERNVAPPRDAEAKLSRVAPLIRGLLAEPSGDLDIPYCRVILSSHTTKQARDFAGSAQRDDLTRCPVPLGTTRVPPLCLYDIPYDADPEALRSHLLAAVKSHLESHGSKPQVMFLPSVGMLCVEETGDQGGPLCREVALVTGAAGAIGFGVCQGLLEKGCRVAATDLPGDRLDSLVSELGRQYPDRIVGVPLDVTDARSVAEGFGAAARVWGGVDIVIVNAGIPLIASLTEMDLEDFRKLARVNTEGTLLTLAEGGRHLKAQATGGDIVLISTKNVFAPGARFGAYSATKAAAHQLGRIASLELAEFDVRVNMVAPDAVFGAGDRKSGLWQKIGPDRMRHRGIVDEEGLQEYYRSRNLLKARVTARHVANAVIFLVTRQTPTTGATIPVDGGLPDAAPR